MAVVCICFFKHTDIAKWRICDVTMLAAIFLKKEMDGALDAPKKYVRKKWKKPSFLGAKITLWFATDNKWPGQQFILTFGHGAHKRELVCNPSESCIFWELSYWNTSLESAWTIARNSEHIVMSKTCNFVIPVSFKCILTTLPLRNAMSTIQN